jgi:hypothetical protein
MDKKEFKQIFLTLILPISLIILGLIVLVTGAIKKHVIIFSIGLITMLGGMITVFLNKQKSGLNVWHIFSMSWLFVDGLFHAFGVADLVEGRAPDAVIARGLLELDGALPMWIHRIMGAFLILTTTYAFYLLNQKKKLSKAKAIYVKVYFWVEAPITIAIIAFGIILNLLGVGV